MPFTTQKRIKIAIDAMGGDKAPKHIVYGTRIAQRRHSSVDFLMFGNVNRIIESVPDFSENEFEFVHTDKFIKSNDKPSLALRNSAGTSMRMAIESVRDCVSSASISAGNTGALMAISKVILRPMHIVRRPAICSFVPHKNGFSVLLDMGANVECDSRSYLEFAIMGDAFLQAIIGKSDVKIGILNIGTEIGKGGSILHEASQLILASKIGHKFIGYVEPNAVFDGNVDVIVTDGFSGNVFIKTAEGTSKLIQVAATKAFNSNIFTKLSYLIASFTVEKIKKSLDYRRYNGAMFVGLNGISIKSHGNADDFSFSHAIDTAVALIRSNINDIITDKIKENTMDVES